jgi:hypothetical protein
MISIFLASCFSQNHRFSTHVERGGSCRAELHDIADSLTSILFAYYHSSGWEISQTDTVVKEQISQKNKKYIRINRKFQSVEKMSADTSRQWLCITPRESLKKRFRWFYTYYAFTAVYPEVTEKGRVPMELYLNKDEQKFYLQGDMSAFRGLNGFELKEVIDDMGERFEKWYYRSLYEESFDIILQYACTDYRLQLPAMKDSLYSVHEKDIDDLSKIDAVNLLDKYFVTDYFSKLYVENSSEMDKKLEEKTSETDELQKLNIQYELTLPGKLMATNSDRQNDGTLIWKINMFKFLADDYTLTAESRTTNLWAFAVTLLLIVFSVYCFSKRSF